MNDLNEKSKKISHKLNSNINQIIYETKKYLDTFKKEDFFNFSNSTTKKEYYNSQYFLFVANLNVCIHELNENISAISSLMIDADRSMEHDLSLYLKTVFDYNTAFEKELYEYTLITEKELKKEQPSISILFDSAKAFLAVALAFKKSLS